MADRARHNNFDALRLLGALMVVHGHGWMLTQSPNPSLWGIPFARVGLDVFFTVSGYLVTGSWERTARLPAFFGKRALRILPGLIACVLATMLLMGPFVTTLPLRAYLTHPDTWAYLSNVVLLLDLHLPGVFMSQAEPGAVNGSLWSLLPEVLCYLTVPLLACLPLRARCTALVATGLACGLACMVMFYGETGWSPRFWHMDVKYALAEAPFFMGGGLIALIERRIAGFWRADVALAFFVANFVLSSWVSWGNLPLEWVTFPYVVIGFGRMSMPVVRRAGRFGDLSFGVYLYAFPLQQLVLQLWPGMRYPVLLCAALSLLAGLLSWHLVEHPALRFKPRGRRPVAVDAAQAPPDGAPGGRLARPGRPGAGIASASR